MSRRQNVGRAVFLSIALAAVSAVRAAVSYDAPGAIYAQNFNLLGSGNGTTYGWTNDLSVPGWHWIGSTNGIPTTYIAANGSVGQQERVLSLGSASASDRALGSQSPNATNNFDLRFGLQLTNNSGVTLDTLLVAYAGEQWRAPSNDSVDSLMVDFQVFAAGAGALSQTSGWTAVSSLNFTSLMTSSANTQLDGNAHTNRRTLGASVSNVAWGAGQELWIRWSDQRSASTLKRMMMGVDDFSFIATTNGGSFPPAPAIISASPAQVFASSTQTVTLAGSNFQTGATVSLSPANSAMAISNTQVPNDTNITFTLTVSGNPAGGWQGFAATNPDGQSALLPNAITVIIVTSLVDFATNGQVYVEDFDSLATSGTNLTWNNGATLPGWFAVTEGGNPRTTYNAADGTTAQAGFMLSMGRALSHPVTDRALGQQNNSTGANVTSYVGVAFRNMAGQTMRSCSLSYTGELWRTPGNANTGDQLKVSYQIFNSGAGSLAAPGGWNLVSSLDFTSPVTNSPAGGIAYDGNAPTNRQGLATSVAFAWDAGQELWFRWGDSNSNNLHQHILAVDDVVFTASTNIIAPVVASASPSQIEQGSSQTVTLSGGYFISGATVTLAATNSAVTISNVQVLDANTITFTLDVASNVVPGTLDFVVTNPDGGSVATVNSITALGPFVVLQNSFSAQSNKLTIIWNSIPGANYAIEQATSLTAPDWTNILQTIPSQGVQTSTQITNDSAATQIFFRIRNTNVTVITPLHPTNVPDLIAFWDFQEASGDRVDATANQIHLVEAAGAVARVQPAEGAPFGTYAAQLPGNRYFSIARANIGALDIHGTNAQVTVIAWLKRQGAGINAVAGIWNETTSNRQYCLFLDIQTSTQITGTRDNRVSGHISQFGGPTPGYPYCYEVSLGDTEVPTNQWICAALTYDGTFIRSWLNGAFDGAEFSPAPPYAMGNPYFAPLGIFTGNADFTVGAVSHAGVMGNWFTGILGGLAIYNRALTADEMHRLAIPAIVLAGG